MRPLFALLATFIMCAAASCTPWSIGLEPPMAAPTPTPIGSGPSPFFLDHQSAVYRTQNDTARTIYPRTSSGGHCWGPTSPPKPIPPGGRSTPISVFFLPGLCADYSEPYTVQWHTVYAPPETNPPRSACAMTIYYAPTNEASPYRFASSGDSLSCRVTLYQTRGRGGVLVHLETVTAAAASDASTR